MNALNTICMALAFALGIVLVLLGAAGLFAGSSAHFTLPPVLGGLPLLFGWGILVAVRRAWPRSRPGQENPRSVTMPPRIAPGVYVESQGEGPSGDEVDPARPK